MKNLFSIALLVFVLLMTKANAQSHFTPIDQIASNQFAFLEANSTFATLLLADFNKEPHVIFEEQPNSQVYINLPITLNDINWTSTYNKENIGIQTSEDNIMLAAIKNVSTTKSDFLGYPIKQFTVRQADFEEQGYFDNSILVYHF